MKATNLTLIIDREKLLALRQYAAKRDVNIEAALGDAFEKLYEKHVPAAVREYLSERETAEPYPRPSRSPRPRAAMPATEGWPLLAPCRLSGTGWGKYPGDPLKRNVAPM